MLASLRQLVFAQASGRASGERLADRGSSRASLSAPGVAAARFLPTNALSTRQDGALTLQASTARHEA